MLSDLKEEQVGLLVEMLEDSYYIDRDMILDASARRSTFNIIPIKLAWFRLGGEVSERQWNDVLGVLKVRGDLLDMNHLKNWSAELELDDLLAKAFKDAGIDR